MELNIGARGGDLVGPRSGGVGCWGHGVGGEVIGVQEW